MCLISRVDGSHHPSPQHWDQCSALNHSQQIVQQNIPEHGWFWGGRLCGFGVWVFSCCFVCLFVLVLSLFIREGFAIEKRNFWEVVGGLQLGICLGGWDGIPSDGMCKNSLLSPCFFQGLHLQQTARSGPKYLPAFFCPFSLTLVALLTRVSREDGICFSNTLPKLAQANHFKELFEEVI